MISPLITDQESPNSQVFAIKKLTFTSSNLEIWAIILECVYNLWGALTKKAKKCVCWTNNSLKDVVFSITNQMTGDYSVSASWEVIVHVIPIGYFNICGFCSSKVWRAHSRKAGLDEVKCLGSLTAFMVKKEKCTCRGKFSWTGICAWCFFFLFIFETPEAGSVLLFIKVRGVVWCVWV